MFGMGWFGVVPRARGVGEEKGAAGTVEGHTPAAGRAAPALQVRTGLRPRAGRRGEGKLSLVTLMGPGSDPLRGQCGVGNGAGRG